MFIFLWKNFTQDNELYQLIVEQGVTKIIFGPSLWLRAFVAQNDSLGRFVRCADRASPYGGSDNTNLDHISYRLAPANDETPTYNDAARLSEATGAYGSRLWSYDGLFVPPLSGKPLAGPLGQPPV